MRTLKLTDECLESVYINFDGLDRVGSFPLDPLLR